MDNQTTNINNICEQIADVYKRKMQQANYNPRDELMNFKWVTEYKGSIFSLYFILPEYWQYAEYGRGPGGMPPVDKIVKWIQFKQIVPTTKSGKVPTTQQLAFAIAKTIAEKGTKGKHLLQQTIDETYNTLVDQLVDAITGQFEKEIEKEIEQI